MMAPSNQNIIPFRSRLSWWELEELTYDQAHGYEPMVIHFTPEEHKREMVAIVQAKPWYKRLIGWLFG
jgi:hypothetical protein